MRNFNRLLAISGASMAAALGALGIGEYQDHSWRQDRQGCYENFAGKPVLKACLNDYDPQKQSDVQNMYGLIVLGLGSVSLFMGGKAYKEHKAQAMRDEEYRQLEGLR